MLTFLLTCLFPQYIGQDLFVVFCKIATFTIHSPADLQFNRRYFASKLPDDQPNHSNNTNLIFSNQSCRLYSPIPSPDYVSQYAFPMCLLWQSAGVPADPADLLVFCEGSDLVQFYLSVCEYSSPLLFPFADSAVFCSVSLAAPYECILIANCFELCQFW